MKEVNDCKENADRQVIVAKTSATYAGPTGHCWGSGSWGKGPLVYPGDLELFGYSLPSGRYKTLSTYPFSPQNTGV